MTVARIRELAREACNSAWHNRHTEEPPYVTCRACDRIEKAITEAVGERNEEITKGMLESAEKHKESAERVMKRTPKWVDMDPRDKAHIQTEHAFMHLLKQWANFIRNQEGEK